MRCLAVQQPLAWAICAGFKRIENRTWQTPYRGQVAIVASGKQTEAKRALDEFTGGRLPEGTITYSAILGTATLSDIVPLSEEVENDPFASGPYCWMLREPKLFQTPIPTKPKLRLYNLTPAEDAKISAESARAGRVVTSSIVTAFARSLEKEPYSRLIEQANSYFATEKWEDVERLGNRLVDLDSKKPNGYFFRGIVALIKKKPSDARAAFDQAIRLDNKYAAAYLMRSDAHDALGNQKAADADYERAIALNPALASRDGTQDDEE